MRLWYSVALALLASAGLQPQQQPVFRSGVDLVTVDVHVVDGSGQPVRDLRPDDFVVTVDGAARRAVAADFVAYGIPLPTAARGGDVPAANAAGSVATRSGPPRTILLVIDESNIRAGAARAAASAAGAFLNRLQPGDRVGLLTIPASSTRIEPTTDRTVVRQALDRIVGHFVPVETRLAQRRSLGMAEAFAFQYDRREWSQILARECVEGAGSKDNGGQAPPECVSEMEHLARTMMADVRERMLTSARALTGVMNDVSRTPGKKTVILISQELPVAAALAERKDFDAETSSIARAAAQAQATVYVLQIDRPLADVDSAVRPGSTGPDADMAASGLETVTTLTGGRRLMISGRADAAFERIAREVAGFYVIGFEPEARDRDSQPHTVTVKVKRDGTEVRARRLFAFTADAQNTLAALAASTRPAPAPEANTPPSAMVAPAVPEPNRSAPAQPSPASPVTAVAPSQPRAAADGRQPGQAVQAQPAVPAAGQKLPPPANVEELVQRATQWVMSYAEQLSLVIGTEHYAQYMGDQGFVRAYRRELVGEFVLVRVKDDWLGFRDIYQVDGKPVGDRQDRLRKLFLDTPDAAVVQARQINNESARHNLGAMQRNFNVPTMALFFLQPTHVTRFKFRKDGEDTIDGHRVWKVKYEETRKPTIIRTSSGKDMPLTGSFWLDASGGQVLKTHMEMSSEATLTGQKQATPWDTDGGTVVRRVRSSASITVTYKEEPTLGMLVPDKMLETYEGPSVNAFTGNEEVNKINCSATYSDFKRFETSGRVVPPK